MSGQLRAARPAYILWVIILLSVLLHWSVWHHDISGIHAWRQTQTMTVVENFAHEDMNILSPRINARGDGGGVFRMEFPLMQWVFAWSYLLFGDHLLIVRMLTFLISIGSVLGFYQLLRFSGQNHRISALGAWCFSWSPVFFYYSVNPLPDNLALCFGIWALVFLKRFQTSEHNKHLLLFALLLSLATAVKLPFVLFGAGYIPLVISRLGRRGFLQSFRELLSVGLLMGPAAAWYVWVIPSWGNAGIIHGIGGEAVFDYVSALHVIKGTLISLLPELLINYGALLFFLVGTAMLLWRWRNTARTYLSEIFILLAVLAYYLYEVNMIELVHDYYLFPFLPLIFLVVTYGLKQLMGNRSATVRAVVYIALFILPLTAFLRTQGRWDAKGSTKVLLTYKQELRSAVPDSVLVVAGNDPSTHIMLYHIGKKGWTFDHDDLTAKQLQDHRNHGAAFLYCNSALVNSNPEIRIMLKEAVFEKEGFSVYPIR